MYENERYDAIDLKEMIKLIKKRIKLLIIVPIIFTAIGTIVSIYFINPVYEASTTLIVRQNKVEGEAISKTDVDLSKSLIYTYVEIAKSNTVYNNTKKALNLGKIAKDSITISSMEETQILKIKVQNENPKLAMDITNTVGEQFALEVIRITKTDNVAVIDYAQMPEKPIKPHILLNTIVSGMLGGILILLIIFLIEYFDNTVKTENDIEKYLKISLVGTIPNISQGGKKEYGYRKDYVKVQSRVNNNGGI